MEFVTEFITDKNKIIKLVKARLKKEYGIIDLTGFIEGHCPDTHTHSAFVRDIAHKLERTGAYKITVENNRYLISKVPKTWREKHPFWNDVRIAAITAGFSILVTLLVWLWQNREQDQINNQQNEHLQRLSDSLQNLQKLSFDSIRTLKDEVAHLIEKSILPLTLLLLY